MIAEKSEQRRNKRRTDVCACHLYADDRARIFRAEIIRRRMNDTRINGRAPKPYHNKGYDSENIRIHGNKQASNAARQNTRAYDDHFSVAQFVGYKSA